MLTPSPSVMVTSASVSTVKLILFLAEAPFIAFAFLGAGFFVGDTVASRSFCLISLLDLPLVLFGVTFVHPSSVLSLLPIPVSLGGSPGLLGGSLPL